MMHNGPPAMPTLDAPALHTRTTIPSRIAIYALICTVNVELMGAGAYISGLAGVTPASGYIDSQATILLGLFLGMGRYIYTLGVRITLTRTN